MCNYVGRDVTKIKHLETTTMQNNKLRAAIRATAALTAFGLAAQAQAVEISAGDVNAEI